ncbi:2-hydroxyacid dehydrogenase [Usitatibacter palustris]|uniref:Glyoxylate/hydroxypyruvate reductase B n=1 Tax=Usitatibacter palustris TaxID=2732487 RepID=A0A6M4H9C5_9PROT|nr:Glyoxylate/hydroxypyruvate reductase B [Usitatibacter palustris]
MIAALQERFDVVTNVDDTPWSPDEIAAKLAGCEAAMSTVLCKFDASVFERNPQLKVVSNIAVGYNNIDVAAATKHGVRVTNTPGVLDDTTADLTWALLMATARRIAEADAWVRGGEWKIAFGMHSFLGTDIHHATLGIIGMGRIGQAIARRASGFDMTVLYHNRSPLPAEDEKRLNATRVERDELLARSDFVVVMVPYSPATHHLIGAADIAKMKPGAILVNTARGGVVDDAALVQALREGRIAGAGLDVFEGEPKLHAGYLDFKNVVLTPHIGSATRSNRIKMCETAVANLTAVLDGKTPANLVNKELA